MAEWSDNNRFSASEWFFIYKWFFACRWFITSERSLASKLDGRSVGFFTPPKPSCSFFPRHASFR
jgi:hypothetical protein